MTRLGTWTTAALIAALAAGSISGCDKAKKEDPVQGKKKGTVGLSVLTLSNPFFKEIADSMAAELGKHGYELIVTDGDFKPEVQQNQVKDFLAKNVVAIVLTPCDSKAVGEAIKEANAKGIPVFTADIACTAADAKVVTHIATDNYGGGKMAAQAIVKGLRERGDATGEIAIIDHDPVESVQMRTKGFLEQLAIENKAADCDLKVVKRLPGGGDQAPSKAAMETILQSNPQVKAIFAINDPTAFGAVAAIEVAKKSKQILVVGFDGQPQGKQYIKEGKIYADPIQFPDRIGRITAQTILDYRKGKEVKKEILIPTALYYKADAEKDPALK